MHERPALLVIKGRALMLTGEMNALEAWLEHLESSSASESVVKEVATIRAILSTSASVDERTVWESLDTFTLSMHSWSRNYTQASYAAAARAVQAGQASGLRSSSLLAAGTMAALQIVGLTFGPFPTHLWHWRAC